METKISQDNGTTIVELIGKLDALTSSATEIALLKELEEGKTKLILDFGELSYISSAGLRIILKLAKEIKAKDGKLVLCNMKDFIKEIFDVSGFSGILSIVENLDAAKKQMNN